MRALRSLFLKSVQFETGMYHAFFREINFTEFFVKLVSRKKCIRRGRGRVCLEGIGIFFEVKSANSLCYIVNSKTKINGLKKTGANRSLPRYILSVK